MAYSFVHYGRGYVDTIHLHHEGNVSFSGGYRHGRWVQDRVSSAIYIEWDCRGDQENVRMHVYRRLPADVNVWELMQRDTEAIPNRNHPFRCLLIMTNTQPMPQTPGPQTPG